MLAAAERLFAERGVGGVTMDDIAAAAGVGKGTLYRRFVDKGGLGVALLDQRERELQAQILAGPPPLGPGADPATRLTAFVTGYLTFLERQLDLVLLSETSTPGARLRTGAHAFWRQHCRYLLSLAGAHTPTCAPTHSSPAWPPTKSDTGSTTSTTTSPTLQASCPRPHSPSREKHPGSRSAGGAVGR